MCLLVVGLPRALLIFPPSCLRLASIHAVSARGLSRSYGKSPSQLELAARIPPGAWDTHMHVIEPGKFPLDAKAQYHPPAHTMDQATTALGKLGIRKMVIVQPSIYGNDNACTLDGLRKLGPKKGRAVIQFDPASTSRDQLQEWHQLGVRGVRLNFKSVGTNPTAAELEATMRAYANAVGPMGWPLELYIGLENVPLLEGFAHDLGVNLIIDHYGHPNKQSLSKARTAHEVPGFPSLARLLKGGNTWVKLSAGYRLVKDADSPLVESLCKEMIRVRPDRCVFATDWPHTRFDGIDIHPYLAKVLDWCEEEGCLNQVLVDNAEILFDARE